MSKPGLFITVIICSILNFLVLMFEATEQKLYSVVCFVIMIKAARDKLNVNFPQT